ncbi:hypothetical protein B0H12DRAFT_538110 [Mycena haematopus]|nr:hypothetical protein B0H12DRAFT_538110 [Mycena haematopus]
MPTELTRTHTPAPPFDTRLSGSSIRLQCNSSARVSLPRARFVHPSLSLSTPYLVPTSFMSISVAFSFLSVSFSSSSILAPVYKRLLCFSPACLDFFCAYPCPSFRLCASGVR